MDLKKLLAAVKITCKYITVILCLQFKVLCLLFSNCSNTNILKTLWRKKPQEYNIGTMFVINDCSRMMCLLYIDRLTVFSRFLLCSGVSFMTLALGKLRPPAKLLQTILIQPVSSKSRRDCWAFYSL